MTEDELLSAMAKLRVWRRGGERAPHKPLLVLLMLGRIQGELPGTTFYSEIEAPLRALLDRYGPSRSVLHPEFPFWHLRAEPFWEVRSTRDAELRARRASPTAGMLRDAEAIGGFTAEAQALLSANPELTARIAELLLDAHFPESLHADLLADVGLALRPAVRWAARLVRDPEFPRRILPAYEHRCAFCELDARIDGRSVALEAAHVRWHSHGGGSGVENGLCLCPLDHKMFDLGALGISEDRRVLVSARLTLAGPMAERMLARHGRPVAGPQAGQPPVHPASIAWHSKEVFKQPPRAG